MTARLNAGLRICYRTGLLAARSAYRTIELIAAEKRSPEIRAWTRHHYTIRGRCFALAVDNLRLHATDLYGAVRIRVQLEVYGSSSKVRRRILVTRQFQRRVHHPTLTDLGN